jgi:hypothetical protein
MAYYGIALHTPEFGSSVYMVFFFGALSELPMTIISKLISHKISVADPVSGIWCLFYPMMRYPGWAKNQDKDPDPG